jgi:predicted acylesterase/phospholipase RssA
MKTKNDFQRALIFQGGGSLGAYEAGAYKAVYELLSREDKELGRPEDFPLFHIVAGTSIGAMNAAVLVSYVKENKSWHGSAERLIEFWEYLSTDSFIDKIPSFTEWWDYWHNISNDIATGESARRYYNTKQFIFEGVPNVFNPSKTLTDIKFFDPVNTWYLYSNEPLKKSIEKFAKFPIATSLEKNEPRLLLVSVDVQEGSPVVFDSYVKEDDSRKSEYGEYGPEFARGDNEHEGYEHLIRYDNGIPVDFVLASGCVPVNYDYTKLIVEDYSDGARIKHNNKNNNSNSSTNDKKIRYFWDGGILANTPLRETIIEHLRYWRLVRKCEVPPLRIGIINLHPIRHDDLSTNYDGVLDRKNDLFYHDKTLFDEWVAVTMSDYINLAKSLIKLAEDNGVRKDLLDNILQQQGLSKRLSTTKPLSYRELLATGVTVDLVLRVERKNDIHTVANKTFDFSSRTIRHLIKEGYEEAKEQLIKIQQDSKRRQS